MRLGQDGRGGGQRRIAEKAATRGGKMIGHGDLSGGDVVASTHMGTGDDRSGSCAGRRVHEVSSWVLGAA
jgi:hypothetical protein